MQTLSFEDRDKALEAKALAEAHKHTKDKTYIFCTVTGLPMPGATAPVGGPTVAELVPGYLLSLLDVTPRTKRTNRRQLEAALIPVVGDMPAAAVASVEIMRVMDSLKRRGISRRTIDRYYNVMKGFFSYTVKIGVRASNPVKEIGWKPQSLAKYNVGRKEDEHFYMTRAQYQLLRGQFKQEHRLLLDFLVTTGARWGEATALRVQAIKLKPGQHPMVDICEAWKEDEDGSFYVGPPKAGSNRVVPVRRSLIAKLQPCLSGKKKTALVFQDPRGGRVVYHDFRPIWEAAVSAAMRCDLHPPLPRGKPIAKADLKGPRCRDNGGVTENGRPCGQWVTPGWNRCFDHRGLASAATSDCECWDRRLPKRTKIHDLRHTHVAWLIAAGTISVKAISMRLGHSSTEVTEKVYAGLLREIDDRILDALVIDEDEDAPEAA